MNKTTAEKQQNVFRPQKYIEFLSFGVRRQLAYRTDIRARECKMHILDALGLHTKVEYTGRKTAQTTPYPNTIIHDYSSNITENKFVDSDKFILLFPFIPSYVVYSYLILSSINIIINVVRYINM